MKKYLILFLCCLLYAYNFLAQDIRCEHKVLSLGKLKNNQHFMTTEIKTNTIKNRLNASKHNTTLTFDRKIYNYNTVIKKEISESNTIKETTKEISYIELKDEVNLDDY